jgi:hypothetical protein
MKCKIFIGTWYDAQDAFNKWAKGKTLGKDVIIHTHVSQDAGLFDNVRLSIVVIHPEDARWDKTEPQPTPPEYTAIEDKQDAIELGVTA